MGKHVHVIQAHNPEAKTVTCRQCGEVPAYYRSDNPICSVGWESQRGRRGQHGLLRSDVPTLLDGKVCGICGTSEDLLVDHCHQTGQIRGPLCRRHNLGIGFFRDSVEELTAAAAYLATYLQETPQALA